MYFSEAMKPASASKFCVPVSHFPGAVVGAGFTFIAGIDCMWFSLP